MEQINYYQIKYDIPEAPGYSEAILLQQPNKAPIKVWVRHENASQDRKWRLLNSPAYTWWYDWFKSKNQYITNHRVLTELELFEEIGLDLL